MRRAGGPSWSLRATRARRSGCCAHTSAHLHARPPGPGENGHIMAKGRTFDKTRTESKGMADRLSTKAQRSAMGPLPGCPLCGSHVVSDWEPMTGFGEAQTFILSPRRCVNEECPLYLAGSGADWGPDWNALTND